ncbi:cadherin domain-containing protein [Dactylococcopsis salina]|uniref:Cadherin domain-containing protein n=1 Tax=Dactylococcopsis salina (strain PCC 8305) TaxID=13035 RepID=K9YXK0_DACS8|nr:cadherin domain-containing protein [Dactylococcopsis salina]AFZ51212.1 Cadherin domain-containing protein [Dactylococcopsis salina PCC 8305]
MAVQYIAESIDYETLDLIPGEEGVVNVSDLSQADDAIAPIDLGEGNSFRFYDTDYASLSVDTNGRLIFGTGNSQFENTNLTSNEITPGIIAPFWDDLRANSGVAEVDSPEDDLILYQIEENRIIIEWNNVHFFDGGQTTDGLTFQAILELNTGDNNGEITFNYGDLSEEDLEENNGTSATVGVKAPGSQTENSLDRTLVSFDQNSPLLGDTEAISLTPNVIEDNAIIITSPVSVDFPEAETDPAYRILTNASDDVTLAYSITGGTDADQFTIDSENGTLTFTNPPDFESPTDANADNIYEVTVNASDGETSDEETVLITVTDEQEAPPTDTQYIASSTDFEAIDLIPGEDNVVTVENLSNTDDEIASITLGEGNSFRFYDSDYTNLTIDSNGRLIFGTGESAFNNTDLTSPEFSPGIIAPFWDDLITNSTAANPDTPEDDLILSQIEDNRIIIEWSNVHFISEGDTTDGITFQAILELNTGDDNGRITFNYVDLSEEEVEENNGTSATVGVKAPGTQDNSSFDRTLVSFNQENPLIGENQAIELTPNTIDPNTIAITSPTAVDVPEETPETAYTVLVNAPDEATVTYSITGGTDADQFTIDSENGTLTFTNPPDFESPTDANEDNIYEVIINASDGENSDEETVLITVTDEQETPPTDTQYIASSTDFEAIDLIPGEDNVVTVENLSNTDDDIASITLGEGNSFRFYDSDYTNLAIDSNGRLIFGTGESAFSNTDLTSPEFSPGIIAPFWDDLITNSTAANPDTPEDDLKLYQIEENRIIIEWNNVHFFDGGQTTDGLTFQAILELNTGDNNGEITFNYVDLSEEDLEENNGTSATVGVKAPGTQDNFSFDRTLVSFNQENPLIGENQAIELTPNPIDPNALLIIGPRFVTFLEESAGTPYTVITNSPEAENLTYSISGGADADQFTIDSESGELSFNTLPDFESPTDANEDNIYEVSLTADDGETQATQDLSIAITNQQEQTGQPPNLEASNLTVDLATASEGTVIGTLNASDPNSNPLTYAITEGNTDNNQNGTSPVSVNDSGEIILQDIDDLTSNLATTFTFTATVTDTEDLTDEAEITVDLGVETATPSSVFGSLVFGTLNNDQFNTSDLDSLETDQDKILFFGAGNTSLEGTEGEGNNRIYLGAESDTVLATAGDRVFTKQGNDQILVGANNRIYAGEGDDRLFVATEGNNVLRGGNGDDQFWIANGNLPDSANTITDFTSGEDVLGISGFPNIAFDDLSLNSAGENTVIGFDPETPLVELQGIEATSLSAEDFVFLS